MDSNIIIVIVIVIVIIIVIIIIIIIIVIFIYFYCLRSTPKSQRTLDEQLLQPDWISQNKTKNHFCA